LVLGGLAGGEGVAGRTMAIGGIGSTAADRISNVDILD
jgi:hypothetical protein